MKHLFLFSMLIFTLYSCERNATNPNNSMGEVELSVQYIPELKPMSHLPKVNGNSEIDSIVVTRARFLIRSIRLKSEFGDSIEFASEPKVVELALDGSINTIAVTDIPPGTYNRLEFRIHRLDDDDPVERALFALPEFSDFVKDNRYSILIEGIIFEQGQAGETFVFRSRENEVQRHSIGPNLNVSASGSKTEVGLKIYSGGWFFDSENQLLDPRESGNENEISDNLENSIKAESTKNSSTQDDDDYDSEYYRGY